MTGSKDGKCEGFQKERKGPGRYKNLKQRSGNIPSKNCRDDQNLKTESQAWSCLPSAFFTRKRGQAESNDDASPRKRCPCCTDAVTFQLPPKQRSQLQQDTKKRERRKVPVCKRNTPSKNCRDDQNLKSESQAWSCLPSAFFTRKRGQGESNDDASPRKRCPCCTDAVTFQLPPKQRSQLQQNTKKRARRKVPECRQNTDQERNCPSPPRANMGNRASCS
ncbi:hypothetical protein NP493_222g03020 [Ridgeia piscesae]|uniref:Uncharacterized protein n=1 Tax=Ridgeia piscesae TaxID=27915 RepID=A0AAD9P0B5_RIDPI|nr:hypothetical protein NP493_222g03020 [Ridgeia piscesae]